ncbi:ABC transporter ATP-binding protein [Marinilabiliaceae bacterium JC017]|nr:ABC transporter ATP-binding protein [Marinilabiliaceae bacterium JC017]
MIKIQQVSKSFEKVQAVRNVSLDIEDGELFGVIGPDGAGKTTLFRMVNSLLVPDEGHISLWGIDPVKNYRHVRTMIGYMPGKFSLYYDLTIEENLKFFATVFGTTVEENYHLIEGIYKQIEPFKDRPAGKLSGGMKQKLALSCALIHKPKLLVLDEPTTGVDAVSRKEFWEMLQELRRKHITILVSTPYMDEAEMCDRVALMQKGEVLACDKPEVLTSQFNRPLLGIKTADIYRCLLDLRHYPQTESVFPFGEYLHYTDQRTGDVKPHIEAFLKEKGHQAIQVIDVEPDIEDRFMQLMGNNSVNPD